MSLKTISLLFVSIFFVVGFCTTKNVTSQTKSASQKKTTAKPQPSPTPLTTRKKYRQIDAEKIIVDVEKLEYNGFEITKEIKEEKYEGPLTIQSKTTKNPYVYIKKNGKILKQIYGQFFSYVKFGLYSFLGGKEKQLFVQMLDNRVQQYFVLTIEDDPRVIFDSGKFGEIYIKSAIDIDDDGTFEFQYNIDPMACFGYMGCAQSPSGTAVFKYDKKLGEYVLANNLFQDYLLKDLESNKAKAGLTVKKIKTTNKTNLPTLAGNHQTAVFRVMLDYVYAGKEKEAWEFFESTYSLNDKQGVKKEIIEMLGEDTVYQLLYKKTQKSK